MLTRAHLDALRRCEIDRVLAQVPMPRGALLEIGAAGGFQAALLAERFATVEAVDLASSIPPGDKAFPVRAYDGHRLPFPDASFDMVFSSNVLEHIPHVETFQAEIRRVLRPGGRAVHVLPSASWRFWTTFTHYLDLPLRVLTRLRAAPADDPPASASSACAAPTAASPPPSWRARLGNLLFEYRHGERGSTLTELYLFSRFAWAPLFRRNGFAVDHVVPLRLFYTGYSALDARLGIDGRTRLAPLLGSATLLYVLSDARGAVPSSPASARPGSPA